MTARGIIWAQLVCLGSTGWHRGCVRGRRFSAGVFDIERRSCCSSTAAGEGRVLLNQGNKGRVVVEGERRQDGEGQATPRSDLGPVTPTSQARWLAGPTDCFPPPAPSIQARYALDEVAATGPSSWRRFSISPFARRGQCASANALQSLSGQRASHTTRCDRRTRGGSGGVAPAIQPSLVAANHRPDRGHWPAPNQASNG